MLPVAANPLNYTAVPAWQAIAALPDSVLAQVPYDTVAPSVSSAQVGDNARGNAEVSAAAAGQPPSVPLAGPDNAAAASAGGGNALAGGQAAAFLAQLATQDQSVPAQVVLVEYEKMVAYSNVRYKPSNALKPPPDPAGLFGQLLQQEKPAQAAPQSQPPLPPQEPAASVIAFPSIESSAQETAPPDLPGGSNDNAQAAAPAAFIAPRGFDAYISSLRRTQPQPEPVQSVA